MPFAEGTPTAQIELNGKSYTLGFTLGAMKRAKDLGVLTVNTQDDTDFMLALPGYVWACMDDEARKESTPESLAERMHPHNARAIAKAVTALFVDSLPREEPQKNSAPAAVKTPTAGHERSTSTNSGRLESTTFASEPLSSGASLSSAL